jgi:hypothetical protein
MWLFHRRFNIEILQDLYYLGILLTNILLNQNTVVSTKLVDCEVACRCMFSYSTIVKQTAKWKLLYVHVPPYYLTKI